MRRGVGVGRCKAEGRGSNNPTCFRKQEWKVRPAVLGMWRKYSMRFASGVGEGWPPCSRLNASARPRHSSLHTRHDLLQERTTRQLVR